MPEITDIALIDRTTKRVRYSDGKQEYHCRGPQNTIGYFDGSGVLRDQDVNFGAETYSKSVNGLWLRNKNSTSVGVRLDGVLTKYLGMRPDDCQDGSVQLEFSIENIKMNDATQSVALGKSVLTLDTKQPIDSYSDMIRVFPYRQGCRQLVKATNGVRSFSITYRIHVTGLELVSNDLGEFWFVNKAGEVKFRIRKPVLCDINTLEPLYLGQLQLESSSSLLTHSLKIQPDGTYLYTKQSAADLSKYKLPPDFYIDVDTVYSTTADGYILNPSDYATPWSSVHDATQGTSVYGTATRASAAAAVRYATNLGWQISRAFFYYNLSGLSGTCTSATFYFYGYSNTSGVASIQQGTQSTTLDVADFDAFSGSSWGSATLSTTAYAGISANSDGLTAINAVMGSILKTAVREYSYDYQNSEIAASYSAGLYFSNYTGTTYDPYVSITLGAAESGHPTRKRHAGNPFTPFRKGVW